MGGTKQDLSMWQIIEILNNGSRAKSHVRNKWMNDCEKEAIEHVIKKIRVWWAKSH